MALRREGAQIVLAVLLVAAACGGEELPGEAVERPRGDAEIGDQVLSTVDGVPIEVAEVREVSQATVLAPAEALRRLQERELLAAEAARRGYDSHPEVRFAAKRAAVQALLAREIEAAVEPESIPEEEVRARWQSSDEYHRPERRRVSHVLARLPEGAGEVEGAAARRAATSAITDLRRATEDVAAVLERYRGTEREGVQIIVEDLPPMAAGDAYEEPFKEAVFSLHAPGVVPEPVRSSYGWHAVVVREITPPLEVAFVDAEEELRRAIAVERRRERMNAFLSTLAERYTVRRKAEVMERALARELPEPDGAGER